MTGTIFSIVRTSLHDGPGVRTVVYFKGCPLRCRWCHNPEGLSPGVEVQFYDEKCIGCGRCRTVCAEGHREDGFHREVCRRCGRCAERCPAEALVLCGREWEEEALFREIARDRTYYDRSGGGVTFSGGECFVQPEFLEAVSRRCREAGIRTAAESSLYFDPKHLDIACAMDVMLVDLKLMDDERHRQYTGVGNGRILENLRRLSERHGDVTVRIPMIPGVNDGEENLAASAAFLNGCGKGVRQVELLPYNDLAGNKYTSLGKGEATVFGEPQKAAEMEGKRAFLRERLRPEIAVI